MTIRHFSSKTSVISEIRDNQGCLCQPPDLDVTDRQCQHTLPGILPLSERAAMEDEILEDRLDNLLPELMQNAGIDMWIIISREYNEDPVMKTMLPAPGSTLVAGRLWSSQPIRRTKALKN